MHPSILLAPLGLLFGAISTLRGKLFDWGVLKEHSFPIPLICVGNLAVGGTGKTPHVELILRILHEEGYKVAMLSRGYGRKTKGYLLAGPKHTARDIGDEPYQVMHNCPFAHVAVCEKRVVGVQRLMEQFPHMDAIILDDAYQHRYVKAGLNILLTDASRPYTDDHFLPWGRLRESAQAASRAHLIVMTKCQGGERPKLEVEPSQRLFYSSIDYGRIVPFDKRCHEPDATLTCAGREVLLVTGIANPQPLKQHLLELKAFKIKTKSFADHHAFTSMDMDKVYTAFRHMDNSPVIVTTEKDATRFKALKERLPIVLREALWVQPITVKVEPAPQTDKSFKQIIIDYVSENSRNSRMAQATH